MEYKLTDKGVELLAKINAGNSSFHLSKAKSGTGYSSLPQALMDVQEEKQEVQILEAVPDGGVTTVSLLVTNTQLEEGYNLKQLGLYAIDDETQEEVLFIIGQDFNGDKVPSAAEGIVEYTYNVSIKVSNTANVVIEANAGDFVLKKVFDGAVTELKNNLGKMEQLKTNEKSNFVGALNEVFQSASDFKAAVAEAVTGKGVETSATATKNEFVANIKAIQSDPILQSKSTTLDVTNTSVELKPDDGYDGLSKATVNILVQEKIASLSTSTQTINPDDGYVLGGVIVPAVEGNAETGDVVAGKGFNSAAAGIGKTGTLADKTGTAEYTATATLDSTNKELQMAIPATGKYNTSNKLKATFATIASLIGLTAAKIVKGNTILGITGNSNNMDTSGGDAAAGDILYGKKAGVDGELRTGTMANRKDTTVDAIAVSQDDTYTYFTPPAGCYSEGSKIREKNSNLGNLKLIHAGNNYPSYATITGELTVSDDSPVTLQQTPQTITLKKGKKYLVVIIGVTGHLSMSDTSLITHQIDLKTTMPGDTWMYNSLYLIEPTSDTDITINSFWGVSLIFEI